MPDFVVIIGDRPVGGEFAAAGGIENAHTGPALAILICCRHLLLGINKAAEVGSHHPGVVRRTDCINDRVEEAGLE